MKSIIVLLLILVTIFIGSCDSRDGDKPEMEFWANSYTLLNDSVYDTCRVFVQLEGSDSYIDSVYVLLEYDRSLALYNGGGAADKDITNSEGYFEGYFIAADSVLPNTEIELTARMRSFHSVSKTITLSVLDTPEFSEIIFDPDTIRVNEQSSIHVKLLSESENISNVTLILDSDLGTFESDSLMTDDNGEATGIYYAPETTGYEKVRIKVKKYPAIKKEKTFQIYN